MCRPMTMSPDLETGALRIGSPQTKVMGSVNVKNTDGKTPKGVRVINLQC